MTQRHTKKPRAEDAFAQHRKRFRFRAESAAMGRFHRMNYIRRLATQALAAGDTAAYEFFGAGARRSCDL
jgi:hypothetical protein